MDTIGFVGLGAMGAPMAWNLDAAGYSLEVYNRSESRTEPFADAGVTVCDTPREVAADADAVFVMVAGGEALRDVLTGEDGVRAGLDDDEYVVNSSTVSAADTEDAARLVTDAGGRFVDAPVSGTVGPAEDGTLTVLAGGTDEDVAAVEPLLETIGDPVVRCGPVGKGTETKLFVNLLLGGMLEAFSEALVFGRAHDLDIDTMLDVVDAGGVAAPMFRAKGESIRRGDFEPAFSVDLLSKDLDLILNAAGEADVPLPAVAATREAASATRGLGHGDEDMSALVKHLETLAGVAVRDD